MSPTDSLLLLAPIWLLVIGCAFAIVFSEFASLAAWARRQRELERLWSEEPFTETADERDVTCA